MRTNIELNDDLVKEARKYSSSRTKRGLIEEALKTLIEVRASARRREAYGERVQSIQSRLAALTLRDGPHQLLREDRSRP